jgi:hypothetical protein
MIKSELDLLGTEEYKKVIKYFYDNIHFDCNFQSGICIREKRLPQSSRTHCCCERCEDASGYFSSQGIKLQGYINTREIYLNKFPILKNNFNSTTGFWRKNRGCILPREFRSLTCNFFVCHFLLEKLTTKEFSLLLKYRYWRDPEQIQKVLENEIHN